METPGRGITPDVSFDRAEIPRGMSAANPSHYGSARQSANAGIQAQQRAIENDRMHRNTIRRQADYAPMSIGDTARLCARSGSRVVAIVLCEEPQFSLTLFPTLTKESFQTKTQLSQRLSQWLRALPAKPQGPWKRTSGANGEALWVRLFRVPTAVERTPIAKIRELLQSKHN